MKKYKEGTKFEVCSEAELIKKGWVLEKSVSSGGVGYYYHDDFTTSTGNQGPPISTQMITHEGSTLTIKEEYSQIKNWYYVEENTYIWPAATFLEEAITIGVVISNHECSEGITPIDGWFICKNCGKDLRKIR